MANTVEFRNVRKRFGDVVAIDDVSLSVKSGEIVALLGPSGCGKTTMLRCIAGFETPDAGSILIAGADITNKRPYERNVGLLFQHYALFPHLTVGENVAYGLHYRGTPKRDIPARVSEMLELVRLPGFERRRQHQLSGGQQQRVALARALATRPGLVLLDEPLSALDAKLRQELRAELKQLLAKVGSTAIVVTHDQEEAMSLGERVFVMNQGRIVQSGAPEEVYQRPMTRFVADFMGRANWFHGRIGVAANGLRVFKSDCGIGLMAPPSDRPESSEADLCIRPESIDILPTNSADEPTQNRIPGEILDIALLGSVRQVIVGLPGGSRLTAVQPNRPGDIIARGMSVIVGFPQDACVMLPVGSTGHP